MSTPGRHRFSRLRLGPGARWPEGITGRLLLRKLERVGTEVRQNITITSGKRSPHEAWHAYADYLRGGNLAAHCCDRTFPHTWKQCGRKPTSNHCISRAADCLIDTSDRGPVNIGESAPARKALRRNGLCLPIGFGETWHVEVGDTWNS